MEGQQGETQGLEGQTRTSLNTPNMDGESTGQTRQTKTRKTGKGVVVKKRTRGPRTSQATPSTESASSSIGWGQAFKHLDEFRNICRSQGLNEHQAIREAQGYFGGGTRSRTARGRT